MLRGGRALACGSLVVASGLALFACTSFSGEETPTTTNDGGAEASPLDAGADAPAPKFCPTPLPADTACFDFDDGLKPGGKDDLGALEVDDKVFYSPGFSLAVRTNALTTNQQANVSLIEARAAGATKLHVEHRLRLDDVAYASITRLLAFESEADHHAVSLVADGTSLSILEGTMRNNVQGNFNTLPVGTVKPNAWFAVAIDLELSGVGTTATQRKLRVSIDDAVRLDDTESFDTTGVNVGQMVARVGMYVYASKGPIQAQTLHIDDLLVRFPQ